MFKTIGSVLFSTPPPAPFPESHPRTLAILNTPNAYSHINITFYICD